VRVFHDMRAGLKDCDVIVMLRLQSERMGGALLPSAQEFFKHYGLTGAKLSLAKPDAIVMHPGPMNRGGRDRLDGRRRPALGDPAAGDLRHRSPDGGDEHRRGQLIAPAYQEWTRA